MAGSGQNFNETVYVAQTPETISQALVSTTTNVPGYTGAGSLVLTRRYTPTWAIVVAVVGVILALIGLLALLVKSTETLTVTLVPVPGGTRVTTSGVGSAEMLTRLTAAISALPSLDPAVEALQPPLAAARVGTVPDFSETKSCPQCAETVKAAAKICRFCNFDFTAGSSETVG
jgi:hypothetical protein